MWRRAGEQMDADELSASPLKGPCPLDAFLPNSLDRRPQLAPERLFGRSPRRVRLTAEGCRGGELPTRHPWT
ncbi:hypothetical protein [Amycolatopsis sp.]|uniref:hypothetical protein n=1 Tax=Amycolatopsis sp. TaxID=37632 RepID=UPI002D81070C|nr:hypothetical protein [Amycolatopsis sp.]HET6711191.1 hypothetical protein [Amycolatopsis sp.]